MLALAVCTILVAYVVFGATGFGSSIVSVPLLAHFLPLTFVVPIACVLDLGASMLTGVRRMRQVERGEIGRLLIPMVIGIALGVTLLVHLPANAMLFGLGAFVGAYGVYSLFQRGPWSAIAPGWSIPVGLGGGAFSALFGTGGPVYVIFLSGRIADKTVLRATVATVIAVSAFLRFATFAATGFFRQSGLVTLCMFLLPSMLLGLWLGNHAHHRLPRERIVQLISVLLILNGLTLLLRGLR